MATVENSRVQEVLTELDRRMKHAVEVIGGMAETAARDACPADTGLLRNSITHGAAGGKVANISYGSDSGATGGDYGGGEIPADPNGKYTVVVGTNVFYAPYVELGTGLYATGGSRAKKIPWRYKDSKGNWHTTSGMKARPFLRPAFENNTGAFIKAAEDILKGNG